MKGVVGPLQSKSVSPGHGGVASPSTDDARAAPRDRGIARRDPALCVTVGTMRGERCGLRDREKALCATLKVYLYRLNAKCLGCIQSEEERIESQ